MSTFNIPKMFFNHGATLSQKKINTFTKADMAVPIILLTM